MIALKKVPSTRGISKYFSDVTLTHKAGLNAITVGLDYGARLVVGFLMAPLLVAGLGDYVYGIWLILSRLTGYLTVASGRPTQTLQWTIASLQHSTDYTEKRRNVGSAVAVWLIFSPILLLLGGILTWFTPMWLDVPTDMVWLVRVAVGILVLKMVLLSLVEIPQSVLQGENSAYKRMGLSALLVLVGGGLMALSLYLEGGLIGVALSTLITTVLTGIFFWQVTRTHVHWFGLARPTTQALRRFLGLSGWFLLWRLVLQVIMGGDIVLLGIVASVESVTTYSFTKYVSETLVSLVIVVVSGISPGLGGIIGAGDLQRATEVRSQILSFAWLVATTVGVMVLLWNETFVRLWVGAEYFAGVVPNLLIMIMMVQLTLIRNDAHIIDLTLDLSHKVLLGIVSVLVSLSLAVLCIRFFDMGILGLCLGFIGGRSILSLGYPMLIGRSLQISLSSQFKGIVRPALVTALLFGLCTQLHNMVRIDRWLLIVDGWIEFIFALTVTLVAIFPVIFFSGLSSQQRHRIVVRVQKLLSS